MPIRNKVYAIFEAVSAEILHMPFVPMPFFAYAIFILYIILAYAAYQICILLAYAILSFDDQTLFGIFSKNRNCRRSKIVAVES